MSRPTSRQSIRCVTWTVALLSVVSACREQTVVLPEAAAGPLVADSAGVRIIQDSAPVWGATPQWTVASTPSLDLGPPTQPFAGLASVIRMANGTIVVADGGRQSILYFDPTGKLLATAGGRGGEDGKFHGLEWIGRGAGDTVVAYDFLTRHLSLFDGKGKFVRKAPLLPADPKVAAEPVASYPDGSVLFRLGAPPNPFPGQPGTVLRDSASYLRFGLDGLPEASMGRYPQGESFGVLIRPKGPPSPFPVAFGLVTAVALRSDTMLIGTGARFEVAAIGPDGAPVSVLRADIPREPVTAAESKAYTQSALTRLRAGAQSLNTTLDSGVIRAVEKAPFPARKPAFARMLVDQTGALWLAAPQGAPATATSWTVFAPDGTWLGTVTTPENFRIDEIGADYLLGVLRDPHGEERVRMYPLARGTAS